MPEQKVAIVTGASSGIGAAVARDLAQAGCHVVVNYSTNREGAETVVADCRAHGVDAIAARGDVSIDADCRELAGVAWEAWNRIDVLVNNAGVTRFADTSDLDALTAADFEAIFAVNVIGSYQMTRAAVPALRESDGAVVNISSNSGFIGTGSSLAYAASKGALNTLTLGLARSLAPDVRVNAVCPGFVDTDWMAPVFTPGGLAAFKQATAAAAPLGRIPTAEDVAEAVRWLALGARSVTGQLVVMDAGAHLTSGESR